MTINTDIKLSTTMQIVATASELKDKLAARALEEKREMAIQNPIRNPDIANAIR
jgi:hypothetical protein